MNPPSLEGKSERVIFIAREGYFGPGLLSEVHPTSAEHQKNSHQVSLEFPNLAQPAKKRKGGYARLLPTP